MSAAEQALLSSDEDKLYEALKAVGTQNLQGQNKVWYLKQLQADRETKQQVGISVCCTFTFVSSGSSVLPRCPVHYNKTWIFVFLIRSLQERL